MKAQFAGNIFVNSQIPKIKLEIRKGQGEKVAKCQQKLGNAIKASDKLSKYQNCLSSEV